MTAHAARSLVDSLDITLFVVAGVIVEHNPLDSVPPDEVVRAEAVRGTGLPATYVLMLERCGAIQSWGPARGRKRFTRSAPCPWVLPANTDSLNAN